MWNKWFRTGDCGSTALGFALAFLGLDFFRSNEATTRVWSFPFVVAALPLLDAALAIGRRMRSGGSALSGDRRHFYDLLLARGWSPRQVALACYAIAFAFAIAGWLELHFRSPLSLLAGLIGIAAFLVSALRLGSLRTAEITAHTPHNLSEAQNNESAATRNETQAPSLSSRLP